MQVALSNIGAGVLHGSGHSYGTFPRQRLGLAGCTR